MRSRDNKTSNLIDDKGFTLVELIVTLAIFAVVGIAIASFFAISMAEYNRNTNEVSLQTESQMTWKRIESNILTATNGVWVSNDGRQIELYNYNDSAESNKKYKKTTIYLSSDNSDHTLYYQEYDYTTDKGWVESGDPEVLGNLVTGFQVQLFDKDGNTITDPLLATRPVKVEANIKYEANDRKYDSNNAVAIRNSIVASDDYNILYGK